jgi:hypothetical protein
MEEQPVHDSDYSSQDKQRQQSQRRCVPERHDAERMILKAALRDLPAIIAKSPVGWSQVLGAKETW